MIHSDINIQDWHTIIFFLLELKNKITNGRRTDHGSLNDSDQLSNPKS